MNLEELSYCWKTLSIYDIYGFILSEIKALLLLNPNSQQCTQMRSNSTDSPINLNPITCFSGCVLARRSIRETHQIVVI